MKAFPLASHALFLSLSGCGGRVRKEGLFPRAYLWTLQSCSSFVRGERESCTEERPNISLDVVLTIIHSIICDPHHAQMKRFLAVSLPQLSVQFGSFCRFPGYSLGWVREK